jgi:IS5 family transposase
VGEIALLFMKLFEPLRLKFERSDWASNPEFGLFDTILEKHSELLQIVAVDILNGNEGSQFGRQDTPSVEQIVRAAIYKEVRNLDYRQLEYHQVDSRICEQFTRIDPWRPYSFQVLQKYISRISEDRLKELLYGINKIAITEGLEDLRSLRQDSTVVESNIHYPTNNALVWDCIKESQRLLEHLNGEISGLTFRNYCKGAKKTFFKINNTKAADKRIELFRKQLILFTRSINQVADIVKKKDQYRMNIKVTGLLMELERVLPLMRQVYDMTMRREVKGEQVPNDQKIFSIYELHTDIIVKGAREVKFGHKVNLGTGRSNLILTCEVVPGNPADKNLYKGTLDQVISTYDRVPRDSMTDGGYASMENLNYAKDKEIANIVFNKVVGSLKNFASSKNMESRLKKWRSGIEAVISNLKRGYDLFRCNWKGEAHFKQKVLWSVIAYNIRVMTAAVLARL